MRDRGLITPVQEMRHSALVRAACHECAHTLLRIPCCHRPKGPVAIGQQSTSHKSRRFRYLPPRAKRIKDKRREKTHGPHAETRQADKYHRRISHKRLWPINEAGSQEVAESADYSCRRFRRDFAIELACGCGWGSDASDEMRGGIPTSLSSGSSTPLSAPVGMTHLFLLHCAQRSTVTNFVPV